MQPTHAGLETETQSRNGLKTLASHVVLTGKTWRERVKMPDQQHVFVYPNPANDVVTLLAKEVCLEPGNIVFYDLRGKPLKQEVLVPNERQWGINIADLPIGFYLYQINTGNRHFTTGKLIIIR